MGIPAFDRDISMIGKHPINAKRPIERQLAFHVVEAFANLIGAECPGMNFVPKRMGCLCHAGRLSFLVCQKQFIRADTRQDITVLANRLLKHLLAGLGVFHPFDQPDQRHACLRGDLLQVITTKALKINRDIFFIRSLEHA